MFKLVVLSGASFLGQNLLDALEGRRNGLTLIGLSSLATAANIFRYDRAFLLPPLAAKPEFEARFLELLSQEAPDLILPGRDDDLVYLSEFRQRYPEYSAALPYGKAELALALRDKYQTYLWAKAQNLPFAESQMDSEPHNLQGFVEKVGFPLIAKPNRGQGSQGVWLIPDWETLLRVSQIPDLVFQEFLDPPTALEGLIPGALPLFYQRPDEWHYTLQTLIQADGSLGQIFAAQSKMLMGRDIEYHAIENTDLLNLARAYGQALAAAGWIGPVNLQVKPDRHGIWKAHEINLRFSGGTSARYALGFDEIGEFLRAFYPQLNFTWQAYVGPPQAQVQRIFRDILIPQDWIENLTAQGQWSA